MLVATSSENENLEHFRQVFDRLKIYGILINSAKNSGITATRRLVTERYVCVPKMDTSLPKKPVRTKIVCGKLDIQKRFLNRFEILF